MEQERGPGTVRARIFVQGPQVPSYATADGAGLPT